MADLELTGGSDDLSDDGMTVHASGLHGQVRTGGQGVGELAPPALRDAMTRHGLVTTGPPVHVAAHVPVTRGGPDDADVSLRIDPVATRSAAGSIQIGLVLEDDGVVRWALPDQAMPATQRRGDGSIVVPMNPVPPVDGVQRGFAGGLIGKVVQIVTAPLVDAVAGRLGAFFAQNWEARHRPYRLRLVGRDLTRLPERGLSSAEAGRLLDGPTLLLVHGTGSTTLGGFRGTAGYLAELHRRYDGRVLAFDHPTIGSDPDENAAWLTQELHRLLGGRGPLVADVVAHSRGGLVARTLAERQGTRGIRGGAVVVRSATMVATPNAGTPLADTEHISDLLDTLTNVIGLVPGIPDALDAVLALVKQVATGAFDGLDGIMSMNPAGPWLRELNQSATVTPTYNAMTADYEPPVDAGLRRRLRDLVTDRVFEDVANDLVVPTDGVVAANGSSLFPIDRHLRIDPTDEVAIDHSGFFDHPVAATRLLSWLEGGQDAAATLTTTSPRPVPPRVRSEPSVDEPPALSVDAVDEALVAGDVARLRRVVESLDEEATQALARETGVRHTGVADLVRGDRAERSDRTGDTVVVVPGLLGSNLDVVDGGRGRRVWLNPWRLVGGAFAGLRTGTSDVRPAGVHRVHVPLLLALDVTHEVEPFAYDWRQPPSVSGQLLAERITELRAERPTSRIHLVAHSMGGLVARHALAALGADDASEGDEAGDGSGGLGRLVQLGTPNWGSFAVPLVLRGDERLVTWLAAADLRNSKEEIVDILRGFPGILELLPSPSLPSGRDVRGDLAGLYRPGAAVGGSAEDAAYAAALTAASEAQARRATAAPVPAGSAMVLGSGHWTVLGYRVEGGEARFGRTRAGDGRVPHALALVDGIETWYGDADHGAMLADPRVLGSLAPLLGGDAPTLLSRTDPTTTRGTAEVSEPVVRGVDLVEPVPLRRGAGGTADEPAVDRTELAVGAATGWIGVVPSQAVRSLRIEVVHGLVQRAQGPWLLGHVDGTPLSGTERAVDHQLDGRLEAYLQVGEYPDTAGEPLVVRGAGSADTVLVVGLGPWGELQETQLAAGVTRATLRYLAAGLGLAGSTLTTVLVGTSGEAGLGIGSAVTALVRGVLTANRRAGSLDDSDSAPFVERLRIVEMYEDRALAAARTVRDIAPELDPALLDGTELLLASHLRVGSGGVTGSPPLTAGVDSWRRLRIRVTGPGGRDLQDTAPEERQLALELLGRRAAAPTRSNGLLQDVRGLVGAPGATPTARPTWSTMLWHMLIPPALRHGLEGHLQLVLDEDAAGLPWEMIATREGSDEARALSLRHGMLRQLIDEKADTRIMGSDRSGGDGRALVIGDPPSSWPRLAGARDEARAVAEALSQHGMDVTELIYEASDQTDRSGEILEALYAHAWEIIHIAGHGDHVPDDPERSGVIIGSDHVLRGEHVASMSTTPRLVVLNCCHLGRFDTADGQAQERAAVNGSLPGFAAGISRSLMRHGVPAVVAAGWAVDDKPAAVFATTLHDALLRGVEYGTAVRLARLATFADRPGSTTWGAYQCYGDPGFRIRRSRGGTATRRRPVGATELVEEITRLAARSTIDVSPTDVAEQLEQLLDGVPAAWRDQARCAEATGMACAARGDFAEAVRWYERAVEHASGDVGLQTLQQLANMRTRVASFDVDELAVVETELDRLIQIRRTTERIALLGAAHKRRAEAYKTASARINGAAKALELYRQAEEEGHDVAYTAANIAHLAAVVGSEVEEARAVLAEVAGRANPEHGFWSLAAVGDLAMFDRLVGDATDDDVVAAYDAALRTGPTHGEWASVCQQARTMGRLLDDDSLTGLADRLAGHATPPRPTT